MSMITVEVVVTCLVKISIFDAMCSQVISGADHQSSLVDGK